MSVGVIAVVVGAASSGAESIDALQTLTDRPVLAVVTVVALTAVSTFLDGWLANDEGGLAVADHAAVADACQTINRHTLQLAGVATKTRGLVVQLGGLLDGHEKLLRAVSNEVSGPSRVAIIGEPGSGKSTLLARLASQEAPCSARPVLLLHLGSWTDTRGLSSRKDEQFRFEEWLHAQVERLGVLDHVIHHLFANDLVMLLLDGLDELTYEQQRLLAVRIDKFLDRHPQVRCVVSCRTEEWRRLSHLIELDELVVPSLDPSEVRLATEAICPSVRGLQATSRDALTAALREPVWLSFFVSLANADVTPPALFAERDYRSWLMAETAAARTKRTSRRESQELRAVCRWVATSLFDRQNGTSFDFVALTTAWLPREARRLARLQQVLRLLPLFGTYSLAAGLITGLGRQVVFPTFVYLVVIVAGYLGAPGRLIAEHRRPPRVLVNRSWDIELVFTRARPMRRELYRRVPIALGFGLLVGVVFASTSQSDVFQQQSNLRDWALLVSMPILLGGLGGLAGGLLCGLAGAIAFGLTDELLNSLVAGLVAGISALVYFSLADLGENAEPYLLGEASGRGMRSRLVRSARVSGQFDVIAWLGYGLFYGVVVFFANRLDPAWFMHGLSVGIGGAAAFGVMAAAWPAANFRAVNDGLARSGILTTMGLDDALRTLRETDILVPGSTGTTVRFVHPLMQDHFANVPSREKLPDRHSQQGDPTAQP